MEIFVFLILIVGISLIMWGLIPDKEREAVTALSVVQPNPPNKTLEDEVEEYLNTHEPSFYEQYAEELNIYLNPHRGQFTSWLQNLKAQGRAKLAATLGVEKMEVVNQVMHLAEAVRSGKRTELEFKNFVTNNAVALLEIKSRTKRIIEADKLLIPEPDFTSMRVDKLRTAQDFAHHKDQVIFDNQKDIDKTILLEDEAMVRRLVEYDQKAKSDWKRYKKEKELDIQAAIVANLAPVFEASALTTQLFDVIDTMRKLEPGDVDKMKALKRTKRYLERCINERFEGLLPSNPRRKIRAMEEEGENPES